MCGIVGVIDYSKNLDNQVLENMNNNLYNRGPDDFGTKNI
jgi:asparagine synthetase B (glutamine-hydrolysing)